MCITWRYCVFKLPEKSGHYLVTVRGKTREGYFRDDKKTWRLANREAHNVLAWAELPAPAPPLEIK